MHNDPFLEGICKSLISVHGAHTLLLYGSHADGSAGADSDYDIAAFGSVTTVLRDAREINGIFLDIFVYPEAVLLTPTKEYLRLRGSKILIQRGNEAEDFLNVLEQIFGRGPTPLAVDEIAARKVWVRKMLARIERGDVEGNYRRIGLLAALLEDYFHYRARWYLGPKKSLQWLKEFDPVTHHAFALALEPGANREVIHQLAKHVVSLTSDSSGNDER